jgi:hypothetical protein
LQKDAFTVDSPFNSQQRTPRAYQHQSYEQVFGTGLSQPSFNNGSIPPPSPSPSIRSQPSMSSFQIEDPMPPPPTPSQARLSVAPSARSSIAPSTRSSVAPSRNASIPLTPQEVVTLAELAVSHFRLRKRKGGATKFFDRVEDDLSKEIGRLFTPARQKVQKMVKEYRQKFNFERSGAIC